MLILLLFLAFFGLSLKNVLIIGTDGIGLSHYESAQTTYMDSIVNEENGKFIKLKSGTPTLSSPNWMSIFTGVCPSKHGVWGDNKLYFSRYDEEYKTVFSRISEEEKNLKIFSSSSYELTNSIVGEGVNDSYLEEVDGDLPYENITVWTENFFNDGTTIGNNIVRFVHVMLSNVDTTGQKYGFFSNEHIEEISKNDEFIGNIFHSIQTRNAIDPDEEWLMIVTSAHGGEYYIHTDTESNDTVSTFGIIYTTSSIDLNTSYENDIGMHSLTRIIYQYFGLKIKKSWDFDDPESLCSYLPATLNVNNYIVVGSMSIVLIVGTFFFLIVIGLAIIPFNKSTKKKQKTDEEKKTDAVQEVVKKIFVEEKKPEEEENEKNNILDDFE